MARIDGLLAGVHDNLTGVALDMTGLPAFHRRVYDSTRRSPPRPTLTCGEVATRLGEPHAARAVGQALGANPFPIIVPATTCSLRAAGRRAFRRWRPALQAAAVADRGHAAARHAGLVRRNQRLTPDRPVAVRSGDRPAYAPDQRQPSLRPRALAPARADRR